LSSLTLELSPNIFFLAVTLPSFSRRCVSKNYHCPTLIPPEAICYESFERGTFPDAAPKWSMETLDADGPRGLQAQHAQSRGASFRTESGGGERFCHEDRVRRRRLAGEEAGSGQWTRSRQEADTSVYSLISPSLESEDRTPMFARTTLLTERDGDGGVLNFSFLWDINYPGSDLVWYVDGNFYGWVLADATEFWWQYAI
jgi:hypothetical protein